MSEQEKLSPAERIKVITFLAISSPSILATHGVCFTQPLWFNFSTFQDPLVLLGLFSVFIPFILTGVAFGAGWVGN